MGKHLQTSFAALVCAAGLSADWAHAGPAGMTSAPRQPAAASQPIRLAALPESSPQTSTTTAPITPLQPATTQTVAASSQQPSTWRRIANAMPEMKMPSVRMPWNAKSRATAPPVRPSDNDPLSLGVPTGPATPELVISMAKLSEQRGDVAQARQHYQRALAQWPAHAEVLHEAALMEDRLGQFQVAEMLYQQAVAANPRDAGTLNDFGVCLGRQGKLEQSLQLIEQAIYIQPDKARYRNNAATVLVELRQDQRAMGHLSAVHGVAETQYNMGQLLVMRNRSDEAAPYFAAALAAKPDMEAAAAALAQLTGQPTPKTSSAASPAPVSATPQVAQHPSGPVAMPVMPQGGAAQPMLPQSGPQFGPQFVDPGMGSQYDPSAQNQRYPLYPTANNVFPLPGQSVPAYPQSNVPWVGQATPRPLPTVGGGAEASVRR